MITIRQPLHEAFLQTHLAYWQENAAHDIYHKHLKSVRAQSHAVSTIHGLPEEQGYQVDPARLDFNIDISIQSANTSVTQTLSLNPTQPFVANDAGTVAAKLLGDLATYQSMPDFSSYYLMIPSPAGLHSSHPSHQEIFLAQAFSAVEATGTRHGFQ